MSEIPTFITRPLPNSFDPKSRAALEQMLQELQDALAAVKDVADDHESRITALEP